MREIKFRGKAIMSIEELELMGIEHDSGWVYGNLIKNGNRPMITADILEEIEESIYPEWWVVVEPKSVGQYTGLKGKNGKEIYEGDIVQIKGHAFQRDERGIGIDIDGNYVVKWSEEMELILAPSPESKEGWLLSKNLHYIEVIGNIYEHPHLLKEVT